MCMHIHVHVFIVHACVCICIPMYTYITLMPDSPKSTRISIMVCNILNIKSLQNKINRNEHEYDKYRNMGAPAGIRIENDSNICLSL